MSDRDEQLTMIKDCIARESKLTDWERQFIDSIDHRTSNGKSLTDSQTERLEEIWEKIT